ncbi:MAG: hypothetical protein FWB71_02960 [Defluviitaleaceae bacterium]|nr:hypothetical protein [Defluviitaleaceae bacterium]
MYYPEKNLIGLFRQAGPIFAGNFKFLALITVIAFLPVFVLNLFMPEELLYAANTVFDANFALLEGAITPTDFAYILTNNFDDIMMLIFLSVGLRLVFFPLVTAAATYMVLMRIKGQPTTLEGMFSASLGRFMRLVVTTFTIVLFIAIGFSLIMTFLQIAMAFFGGLAGAIGLFAIFFALAILSATFFYQNVIADIGRWGLNGINVSRQLARGRMVWVFLRTFVFFLIFFITTIALDFLGTLSGLLTGPMPLALLYYLLTRLLLSYFAIVFSCWYFDLKLRNKEYYQSIGAETLDFPEESGIEMEDGE